VAFVSGYFVAIELMAEGGNQVSIEDMAALAVSTAFDWRSPAEARQRATFYLESVCLKNPYHISLIFFSFSLLLVCNVNEVLMD